MMLDILKMSRVWKQRQGRPGTMWSWWNMAWMSRCPSPAIAWRAWTRQTLRKWIWALKKSFSTWKWWIFKPSDRRKRYMRGKGVEPLNSYEKRSWGVRLWPLGYPRTIRRRDGMEEIHTKLTYIGWWGSYLYIFCYPFLQADVIGRHIKATALPS